MKVKVYPADGSSPFELEAPFITLGNSASYGPLDNFQDRYTTEPEVGIIVINFSNVLAVEELE